MVKPGESFESARDGRRGVVIAADGIRFLVLFLDGLLGRFYQPRRPSKGYDPLR